MANISLAGAAGAAPRQLLSRRHVLAAAGIVAAAAVSGCTGTSSDRPPADRQSLDAAARDRILEDKAALLAVYAATVERHPTLRKPLDGFVRRHTAHVVALKRALAATPTNSATTRRPHQAQVPPQQSMAVRALADAEQAATERRRSVVESALSGTFAALVASIAACENAHAVLLRAEADR